MTEPRGQPRERAGGRREPAPMTAGWLTPEEFRQIYAKVPRLAVEIVVKDEAGVLLTKRSIEPFLGCWHLPGGTVGFAEPLLDAVRRVAGRELGIEVESARQVGYIEYPTYHALGLGSPVGVAFEVDRYRGPIHLNEEATEFGFFEVAPEGLMPDQLRFLVEGGYLTR